MNWFQLLKMDPSSNGLNQFSAEKLNNTNYRYWKLCIQAYLQGQDLWEIIAEEDVEPAEMPYNAKVRHKWQ